MHVVQLTERVGFDPHLGRAIDALVARELASPGMAAAHDLLTRLLVTVRLLAPDAREPVESTRALITRALSLPDWETAVAEFGRTRHEVAEFWDQVGGEA